MIFLHDQRSPGYLDTRNPIEWADPLNRGLVGDWTIVANSPWIGGGYLRSLIRRNDGTLTNGPTWVAGPTPGFGALRLNGTSQYVDMGTPESLRLNGDKSLFIWAKSTNFGSSYRSIISFDKSYALTAKDNILITYDWNGGGDRSSGVTINDGLWHRLGLTVAADVTNGSQLWIDGARAGAAFTYATQSSGTARLCFGTAYTSSPQEEYAAGDLCGPSIYLRPLTESEVVTDYDQARRRNPDRYRWIKPWSFGVTATAPTGWGALLSNRRNRIVQSG